MNNKNRTKRCHGNRKLRRFKKKWRKRGKTDQEIKQLIDQYQHQQQNNNNQHGQLAPTATTPTDEPMDITTVPNGVINGNSNNKITEPNKRKRISSTSQSSRSQLVPKKKIKNRTPSMAATTIIKTTTTTTTTTKTTYRIPKYLKALPKLLFQMLRIHLKHTLETKEDQKYIRNRLQLLDRQYRLELHRNLWQSYLTLGSEHRLWPNQVTKITKTNEYEVCQEHIIHHLTKLNQQYDQCTNELVLEMSSCPSTLHSLPTLEQDLKDFVYLQENYISNKMNAQLSRYKDTIHEQELLQKVSVAHLTTEQKKIMDELNQLQDIQMDIHEDFLKFETQNSLEYLPSNFHHIENFVSSDDLLFSSIIKDKSFKQHRYKIIQEVKRTCLTIYLDIYEKKIQEHKFQYQKKCFELQKHLSKQHSFHFNDGTDDDNLYNSYMAYMNHRKKRLKQEIQCEKIPIYRKKLLRLRRRDKKLIKKLVPVSAKVILDIPYNPFSASELAYLSRGSNYIRPNQSVLRPDQQRLKNSKAEHDDIMTKVKKYMTNVEGQQRLPRTSPLLKIYSERLLAYLIDRYMAPIPFNDLLRARRELRIVRSIRYKLIKYKLVLRRTDKSGVFHIGQAQDYHRKAMEYFRKTGAYQQLRANPLNESFFKVVQLLNKLETTKKIKVCQKGKMKPIREKIELAYIYFIPKVHKIGTPLRPIMNTIHAITTGISKFLDKLIRPLFDMYADTTTIIIDGVHLLRKLDDYCQKGHFTASTLFITFDITDLYTMLPQEESLKILAEFLEEHHCHKVNGIAIETIVELARVVLEENVFLYKKKFYRQIIGGAMGSAFTLTLANIFMWKWQKQTILSKLPAHECYGRYVDDIFFTWNGSEADAIALLEEANGFHPNIKLTYTIGKSVPFLDLHLTNQNGILHSSVYHKPAAQPTVLSFLSDHPRHVFRNVIQTALLRAVRYSSTFKAFNIEQGQIRLKLLYNGYPSTYINAHFQHFFDQYLPVSSSSSSSSSFPTLIPFIDDEHQFFLIRQQLLAQRTRQQAERAKRLADIEIINPVIPNVLSVATRPNPPPPPPMQKVTVKREDNKFKNTLFVHCKHEARLAGVKRHIHEIHDHVFKETDFGDIRLIVGNRNNPDMDYELTRKRPPSHILKDQPKKKKTKPSEVPTTA